MDQKDRKGKTVAGKRQWKTLNTVQSRSMLQTQTEQQCVSKQNAITTLWNHLFDLVAFDHIFLSDSRARLERLGGRPWSSHSWLVPVPTRKQLIMCERLSECLLSGQQQQHSAIYHPHPNPHLPWRQDSLPAHHPSMHSSSHTCGRTKMHSPNCIPSLWNHPQLQSSTCTEIPLMRARGCMWQQNCIWRCRCVNTRVHTAASRFVVLIRRMSAPHGDHDDTCRCCTLLARCRQWRS